MLGRYYFHIQRNAYTILLSLFPKWQQCWLTLFVTFLTPDKMLSEMKRVSRTRFFKGKNDTYVISVETRDVYFSSSTIVMLTLV